MYGLSDPRSDIRPPCVCLQTFRQILGADDYESYLLYLKVPKERRGGRSAVDRLLCKQEVGGSSPPHSTFSPLLDFKFFLHQNLDLKFFLTLPYGSSQLLNRADPHNDVILKSVHGVILRDMISYYSEVSDRITIKTWPKGPFTIHIQTMRHVARSMVS